jgi:hypothetical protein
VGEKKEEKEMKRVATLECKAFYGSPEQVFLNLGRERSTLIINTEENGEETLLGAVVSVCDLRLLLAVQQLADVLCKIVRIRFNKDTHHAVIDLSDERSLDYQFFEFSDFASLLRFLTLLNSQEFINEEETVVELTLVRKDFKYSTL